MLAMMVNEQTSFTNAIHSETLKKLWRLSSVLTIMMLTSIYSQIMRQSKLQVTSMLRCYCSQLAVYVCCFNPLNEADSKASQNIK